MKTINTFMLCVTVELLRCYIEDNNFNEGNIEVVEDNGLKLINKTTKQYATGFIYDYDCDFKAIRNKIEKFLKLQNN